MPIDTIRGDGNLPTGRVGAPSVATLCRQECGAAYTHRLDDLRKTVTVGVG